MFTKNKKNGYILSKNKNKDISFHEENPENFIIEDFLDFEGSEISEIPKNQKS